MDRKKIIENMIKRGITMKEIGGVLGVTKQRVYQLLTKYNISPPERKRHGFWRTQTLSQQWLWKILSSKQLSREEKWKLYEELNKKIPIYCPILKITLDYSEKGMGWKGRTDNSPSLDRLDNTKGYIPGNVVIISWRANRVKNDGSVEEHRLIANFYNNVCKVE